MSFLLLIYYSHELDSEVGGWSVSSAAEHLNRRLRNRRPTHSRDVDEKLWIFSHGLKIDVTVWTQVVWSGTERRQRLIRTH